MASDIDTLTKDMLKFAGLLRLVDLPNTAEDYEAIALELRSDSSPLAVNQAREQISNSFRGTSGGIRDRYVQKIDGSVDHVLNAEYKMLLQKLTDFVNGV